METPNMGPAKWENLNLPKKSVSELEAEEHFGHYVAEELDRLHETALAELVRKDKISIIKLEAKKAANTGNLAERSNNNFDVVDHMVMRAQMVAEQLIKNKKQYLN